MYSVEKILKKKINSKTKEISYLIKWKNFDSKFNTWEPVAHLKDYCFGLIQQFQDAREMQPKSRRRRTENKSSQIEKNIFKVKKINKIANKRLRATEKKKVKRRRKMPENLHPIEPVQPMKSAAVIQSKKRGASKIKELPFIITKLNKNSQVYKKIRQKILKHNPQQCLKVEIIGMRKQNEELEFCLLDGQKKRWITHQAAIDQYSKQLCRFYEKNIVFD